MLQAGHGLLRVKPGSRPGHHVQQAKALTCKPRLDERLLQIGKLLGLSQICHQLRNGIGIKKHIFIGVGRQQNLAKLHLALLHAALDLRHGQKASV